LSIFRVKIFEKIVFRLDKKVFQLYAYILTNQIM